MYQCKTIQVKHQPPTCKDGESLKPTALRWKILRVIFLVGLIVLSIVFFIQFKYSKENYNLVPDKESDLKKVGIFFRRFVYILKLYLCILAFMIFSKLLTKNYFIPLYTFSILFIISVVSRYIIFTLIGEFDFNVFFDLPFLVFLYFLISMLEFIEQNSTVLIT